MVSEPRANRPEVCNRPCDEPLTDGERWAREQLGALLARRFAPAACGRFLDESWRRSAVTRHQRPALARRARRWAAVGGVSWLALGAGGAEPFRRRTREGLAWWALTATMLDWHLGMVETPDGRPRNLGAGDGARRTASSPVPASPTTSRSSAESISTRKPERMSAWSSASTTRMVIAAPRHSGSGRA